MEYEDWVRKSKDDNECNAMRAAAAMIGNELAGVGYDTR